MSFPMSPGGAVVGLHRDPPGLTDSPGDIFPGSPLTQSQSHSRASLHSPGNYGRMEYGQPYNAMTADQTAAQAIAHAATASQ